MHTAVAPASTGVSALARKDSDRRAVLYTEQYTRGMRNLVDICRHRAPHGVDHQLGANCALRPHVRRDIYLLSWLSGSRSSVPLILMRTVLIPP
jgi:hypothetical protein